LRLPPPTTDFTVAHGLTMPMRDGVDLVADHYAPRAAAAAGTLLVRCPYGRGFPFSNLFVAVYAARSYHVVVQSVGLSYLGFTQWALLVDPPPEVTAAIITVDPHDFAESSWGTGAFSLNDFLGWSDMMSRQEVENRLLGALGQSRARQPTSPPSPVSR
jgi:predicted acyl esterase